jgi:hypothetical protein
MEADDRSERGVLREFESSPPLKWNEPVFEAMGETRPVGARTDLRGREKIIMTEWGPYVVLPAAAIRAPRRSCG